ncbi:MAG: flagellar motor switch protein FliM [Bacillota bacterium]
MGRVKRFGIRSGRHRVRRYDFYRPDKFSRENLGALRILHDNMARLIATGLSAQVRMAVKVSLIALDQVSYEEFVEQLSNPVVLGVTNFSPLEGTVGIEVCPSISYPLLERLLGSPQETGSVQRPLTDIETAVIQTVFERIMAAVEEAWRGVCELEGSLASIETSPFFSQFAPPNEMMMTGGFLVEMGDHQGRINIGWPCIMLEPVLPELSVQHWMGRSLRNRSAGEEDGTDRTALEGHLPSVSLPVVAYLGGTQVSVRDLLELTEGDIIRLDGKIDQPVDVQVGEVPVFSGRVGRLGSRLAVQITSESGEE